MKILEIEHLSKSYGAVKAVDDISFDIEKGEFFSFLGVNGAGKSTTINIITTVLPKDSGKVYVFGADIDRDPMAIRAKIGIVFQNSVLDGRLSVYDNLSSRAALYGMRGAEKKKRIKEIAETLDLNEFLKRPYAKLSGGQRRRTDIARALINTPELLIMDEPTTGLDPQTRLTVWAAIDRIRQRTGMSVLLTTHYMEESAAADRIVIIDEGKLVAEGSPVALKDKYSSDSVRLYMPKTAETDRILSESGLGFTYQNTFYKVAVSDSVAAMRFLTAHPALTADFEVVKGDMDDVFLNVTGKKLDGGNYERA